MRPVPVRVLLVLQLQLVQPVLGLPALLPQPVEPVGPALGLLQVELWQQQELVQSMLVLQWLPVPRQQVGQLPVPPASEVRLQVPLWRAPLL
ncbi:hypothetical protein PS850_05205 [Pseudomonas fluorescens]|nr:hypothetical protein PS850_05205 [Pseudomonas fluorescens]